MFHRKDPLVDREDVYQKVRYGCNEGEEGNS